jgi:hypothetical protein
MTLCRSWILDASLDCKSDLARIVGHAHRRCVGIWQVFYGPGVIYVGHMRLVAGREFCDSLTEDANLIWQGKWFLLIVFVGLLSTEKKNSATVLQHAARCDTVRMVSTYPWCKLLRPRERVLVGPACQVVFMSHEPCGAAPSQKIFFRCLQPTCHLCWTRMRLEAGCKFCDSLTEDLKYSIFSTHVIWVLSLIIFLTKI